MTSGTEWPAATVQYRLNLAHALHSVSPALSALHASRATTTHPEISAVLHPSHCPRCGTYHFSGDHPSTLVGPSTRKKKRRRAPSQHAKVLQRQCRLCGFIDPSPVINQSSNDSPKINTVPAIQRTNETGLEPPPGDTPTAGTAQTTPAPPSRPKPSHTKTSTLKDMLARDRQREEANSKKKKKEGHDGLAAFLRQL